MSPSLVAPQKCLGGSPEVSVGLKETTESWIPTLAIWLWGWGPGPGILYFSSSLWGSAGVGAQVVDTCPQGASPGLPLLSQPHTSFCKHIQPMIDSLPFPSQPSGSD